MNEEIENLCESLDSLAEAVAKGWNDKRNLNEAFGWHHPAIDRMELAYMPKALSQKIRFWIRKVFMHSAIAKKFFNMIRSMQGITPGKFPVTNPEIKL